MTATLGPNDNYQLWPDWQLPYGALSWLRIQCLNVQSPEWPQLAIASLGPEWPKSAVYTMAYGLKASSCHHFSQV